MKASNRVKKSRTPSRKLVLGKSVFVFVKDGAKGRMPNNVRAAFVRRVYNELCHKVWQRIRDSVFERIIYKIKELGSI